MKRIRPSNILLFLAPVCYLIIAVIVVCLVSWSGKYPFGSDVMYHIYRGSWLYDSILNGNWWPLVNFMWYNGVELLRYWAPLPAFFMTFSIAVSGGSPLDGYLIFVGLICFFGALPWLYIGFRRGRPWLGAFLGALWFFMPNNLFAMFREGNLARSVSMIFLPLLIYGVYSYLERPRTSMLALITVSFLGASLCHLGYGGMIALSILLYLLVDKVITRRKSGALSVIIAILLAFLLLGVWLVPSLVGGITSMDSSETMAYFFQSAWRSLNPFERYNSNNVRFYFGAAAFLLALFGVFFSYKREMPGFWSAILIFICTTSSMYPVLLILPGSQYLWMLRFISIALCLILMSWMFWDKLRRPIVLLFAVLLVADTIPSLSLIYGNRTGVPAEKWISENHTNSLIEEAQSITNQRIALVDFSGLENGAWQIVAYGDPRACTNGAGWEAANTGPNISQLERAVLEEKYLYLFDRSKQLGSDTVIILADKVEKGEKTSEQVDAEAAAVGYYLVDHNSQSRLYHMDVSGTWGTVAKYRGLAIGDVSVTGICRNFPALEEGDSINLNDYTFEELVKYNIIYLSGFFYDEREYAEDLIWKLSEAGVHIVISADGIPEDRKTHNQSFLGVICNKISFSNGYPELNTIDGLLNTDLFPPDHTEWDTVYLEGLDEVWGSVDDGNLLLDFYGTVKNENIVVIGLNLTYFLSLTQDPSVERLLSHAMDLSPLELPEREIVPLEITYGKNTITIVSPEDNVNTSLAYHDIFESDRPISAQNNLTVVDKGTTVITLKYPYLYPGLAVSGLGVLLMLVFLWRTNRRLKWEAIKAAKEERERAEKEGWT